MDKLSVIINETQIIVGRDRDRDKGCHALGNLPFSPNRAIQIGLVRSDECFDRHLKRQYASLQLREFSQQTTRVVYLPEE